MPMQYVEVRRWQVAGAFLIVVACSVAVAFWNDYRIDKAEARIARNTVGIVAVASKAEAAVQGNRIQDAIRAERVAEFRAHDIAFCQEIEAVKDRIRATVMVNDADLRESLQAVNIDPDSEQGQALIRRAHEQEQDTLVRFAPKDCSALRSP